jgi:small-conductance mechanosensitive channel
MEWEVIYEDLKKKHWIILLFVSSVSFFTLSHSHTLGVIIGGLVSIVNLLFLQHTLKKAFDTTFRRKSRKISIFINYYFRLLLLGIIIFILLKYKLVHPVGLVIGLSTIVAAITFIGISIAFKAGGREA